MKSTEWKPISDGVIPDDAFFAGSNPNSPLFVGRAYHGGDLLPGNVSLSNKVCYVPWQGKEYEKTEYEVLTGNNYKWVPYLTKAILVNAVPGGMTTDGTTLYIGRTTYNNTLTLGKVYPYTGLIYIPSSGLEYTFTQYDILVFKS
ncbi:uncharacterized protein [Hetaerina americana]|uniref:uncharacterized protein n=1 Tax=Hetaerina americana TaxID=62018 RepID=UPI003A7F2865